jgi:hypothetical protein
MSKYKLRIEVSPAHLHRVLDFCHDVVRKLEQMAATTPTTAEQRRHLKYFKQAVNGLEAARTEGSK